MLFVAIVLTFFCVGFVLRHKRLKKEEQVRLVKAQEEQAKEQRVKTQTKSLLEELHKNPGKTVVVEDPAELLALIEQNQQLQLAAEEMDRRATVPANYLMIH